MKNRNTVISASFRYFHYIPRLDVKSLLYDSGLIYLLHVQSLFIRIDIDVCLQIIIIGRDIFQHHVNLAVPDDRVGFIEIFKRLSSIIRFNSFCISASLLPGQKSLQRVPVFLKFTLLGGLAINPKGQSPGCGQKDHDGKEQQYAAGFYAFLLFLLPGICLF